jgi:hypothetical protein
VELEQQEAQISEGKELDCNAYAMVASHLRRILENVGLHGTPKTLPSLVQ